MNSDTVPLVVGAIREYFGQRRLVGAFVPLVGQPHVCEQFSKV